MIIFRYDKTFEGLLTAIFDAYSRKEFPDKLLSETAIAPMFTEQEYTVLTQDNKSSRVWASLEKKLSKTSRGMLWVVWLSEEEGSDDLLFRYIRKVLDSKVSLDGNFADEDILQILQLAQKVRHEAHRIEMFVRFQKASDDTYFAPISPIYNALPLAIDHFCDRFADQKWIIYDMKRQYGFYYDLHKAEEITLDLTDDLLATGQLDEKLMGEDEKLFQQLWKGYFTSMTIKERINPKLHRQNMPARFWKYLTEKQ